jgi:hypothetical protein
MNTRNEQVPRGNYSRILPQLTLAFAAMLSFPRSVSICLALLCGIARLLCAQTAPALTPGSIGYVKERIAVKTKTGVIGLDPGAGVRLVSEDGNAVSVSDGTTTFDVPKDKLTADVTEANLAAQNFYVTQQAGVEAFNAEVVRQQEERKRARDEQAAAEQREKEMKKEQIAAQHQQQLLQAQQSLAEWQAAWQWQAAQSSPYDLAAPAPNLSAAPRVLFMLTSVGALRAIT